MKNLWILWFSFLPIFCYAQETNTSSEQQSSFSAEYFYGNILKHQPSVATSISGHPEGVILSWNKKNYGNQAWEQTYNYPDVGFSFAYQDYKSDIVGKLYSFYAHYNFYLLKRINPNQLILRAGIGLAYNTNPYDKVENNKNISFGTHLNSSTYFKLYYQRERLVKNIGLTAGLTFIHASNSNFKSPNTGLNTWGITAGLNYNLEDDENYYTTHEIDNKFTQPIKLNVVFRTGIQESELIGSGLHPFFVFSGYADKRVSRKSAIQLGTDVFISPMLKDFIEYYHINFPGESDASSSDITRIGIFAGHELFINKLSIIAQLGYYIYYPFEYEARYYERLGLKYYFNDKLFSAVSLKAHGANAETVEFGIGLRF